ncbi:MAG: 4Fe-4S dicluster domain-containing protein [Fimbriimonadaceae bacterium]|nr:4Fe-4S dicluster domain-containing protein [Fimbriimonadaceae bacterium]
MPKVYNWQIGRKMEYRYEEAHPKRQLVAVFNTNRCIACQSCTMACKSTWTFSQGQEAMWWNNVETKPYGGYPHNWDAKSLELMENTSPVAQVWDGGEPTPERPYGTFTGKTIFEMAPQGRYALGYEPPEEDWQTPNLYEDTPTGGAGVKGRAFKGGAIHDHESWFFYLARVCNHCSYPACVAACPRQAPYKRTEDGIVLINQERCWGYRMCVQACPYKKAMYRPDTRTSEKCIGCYPRVEGKDPESGGVPMEARCMAVCIGKIRMQGLVDLEDDGDWSARPDHPLYFLIKVAKVALPLYPQFGTQPNIYYIPPRWVPREYLRQMFGPGVDEALDAYTNPSRELLAVLQLFRASETMYFRYEIVQGEKYREITIAGAKRELFDDVVIGYDQENREIARLRVHESLHVRSEQYSNSI